MRCIWVFSYRDGFRFLFECVVLFEVLILICSCSTLLCRLFALALSCFVYIPSSRVRAYAALLIWSLYSRLNYLNPKLGEFSSLESSAF